jgi:type I restriction enzyme, S subunit
LDKNKASQIQNPEHPNHPINPVQDWVECKLGDVRQHKQIGINPAKFPDKKFELYSIPAFETNYPEIVQGKEIQSNKQVVTESTVLLSKINPRINRVWVVGNYSKCIKIASTEWISFSPIPEIFLKFLQYFMNNWDFRNFLSQNVSGVGGSLMRVKPSTIENYPPTPASPHSTCYRV